MTANVSIIGLINVSFFVEIAFNAQQKNHIRIIQKRFLASDAIIHQQFSLNIHPGIEEIFEVMHARMMALEEGTIILTLNFIGRAE